MHNWAGTDVHTGIAVHKVQCLLPVCMHVCSMPRHACLSRHWCSHCRCCSQSAIPRACLHAYMQHDATCTLVQVQVFSHSVCITDIAEVLLLIDAMSSACLRTRSMHSMHSMHACAGTGVQSLCTYAKYHRGIAAHRCHVFCLHAYMQHAQRACLCRYWCSVTLYACWTS